MPWRDSEELHQRDQLCFGIFASDGIVSPHPPIARALRMTVNALEALGHKVDYIVSYIQFLALTNRR
jgi:amidase